MTDGIAGRHVFVYGTLRRGEANDINRRHPAPRWVGEARIQGQMFDLGAYPGVLLGGPQWVLGEVYAVTPELEADLDALEGVRVDGEGEYRKRDLDVAVAGRVLRCLVYEVHPARLQGALAMAGGDWVRRAPGQRNG